MKSQIVGLECSEGTSGKTGKQYSIGQIHAIARLAAPMQENGVAKGYMGTTFRCSVELVRKLAHLPVPFNAELVIDSVMRFGKREEEVIDCVPLDVKAKVPA